MDRGRHRRDRSSDPTVYEGVVSLTLNPSVIDGGTGGTAATVTLNAPAPAGGVVVTLGSSTVELATTLPCIAIPPAPHKALSP